MSRQVWLHLRHLIRRCAWLLASLSSFFFLYTTAARYLRSPGDAESVAVLPSMLLMFFSLPSLFFSVLCWSKLVARFPSAEAGWAGRMRGAAAIVGVSFSAPALIIGGTVLESDLRLLAVTLGSLLVWGALLLPRLLVPGLRGGAVAQDVADLKIKPVGWGAAIARFGLLFVLVGIAFPNFLNFGRQPRWHEARLQLAAIRTAELSYFNEFGSYVAAGPHPANPPGRGKQAWRLSPDRAVEGFDQLGWAPEAGVRCQYAVAVKAGEQPGGRITEFSAEALCDTDGDGETLAWGYIHAAPGSTVGIHGPFGRCPATGVLDPKGRRRLNTVGPCDAKSGRTVF